MAVAAVGGHTCALLTGGRLKCWGSNLYGQCGIDSTVSHGDGSAAGGMGELLPVVDLGLSRTATQVACGNDHTCVILDTKEVKCWGRNQYGGCAS